MTASRLLFVLFFSTLLRLSAAELTEGITRAELEALVGKPTSVLQRGDKTVLSYPNKGRVELVAGRVVHFERMEAVNTPAKAPATPAAKAASVSATPAAKPASPDQAPQVAPAPANEITPPDGIPTLTPEQRARVAKQEAELARLQERLLNGESITSSSETAAPSLGDNPWVVMLLQALFKIPITVLVLKLAFKWSDVDADWSQMWLPAAADTLVRFSVQALAQAFWGLTMLFYVDETLAFFALLIALLKTTHACTIPRAVGVAFAAKLASVVVWAILSVFILGLLFNRAHS